VFSFNETVQPSLVFNCQSTPTKDLEKAPAQNFEKSTVHLTKHPWVTDSGKFKHD